MRSNLVRSGQVPTWFSILFSEVILSTLNEIGSSVSSLFPAEFIYSVTIFVGKIVSSSLSLME